MQAIEVPFLSNLKITTDEKVWLNEVYVQLFKLYRKPTYKEIRLLTRSHVNNDFIPRNINNYLLRDLTDITLLGILAVDPETWVLPTAEKIILCIRHLLVEDLKKEEFTILEICEELQMNEDQLGIVFKLVSRYGCFWNSAASKTNSAAYQSFTIKEDYVIDTYLNFTNIHDHLSQYFSQMKIKDTQDNEKDVPGTDTNSTLIFNPGAPSMADATKRYFISEERITELTVLQSTNFDFTKLIQLCKEINFNYWGKNFYSVAMLSRALIDHIPPVFKYNSFSEVANNYKSEGNALSFKKSMQYLETSMRSICDSSIHSQIRRKEVLPNETQMDFSNNLDVLLGEIIRLFK